MRELCPPRHLRELKPGKAVSISFAVVAEWSSGYGTLDDLQPLFMHSGVYSIQCTLRPFKLQPATSAAVMVKVTEPSATDAPIYKILRERRDLANAIMSCTNEPDEIAVDGLRLICDAVPHSSYVPFARFAIARSHLRGCGSNLSKSRDEWRMAIDDLVKIAPASEQPLDSVLARAFFGTGQTRGLRARAIERVVKSRNESDQARDAAAADLVELLYVSQDERLAGSRELESIMEHDFPYRPNVLIALRIAGMNELRVDEVTKVLDQQYADALEWQVQKPVTRRVSRVGVPKPRLR